MGSMTPEYNNGVAASAEPTRTAGGTAPQAIAESLRQRHKQTAQESLGIPPGTGLFLPFIVASVAMLFLLGLLTAFPYALARLEPPAAQEEKQSPAANDKMESPATGQPTPSTPTAPSYSSSEVKQPTGKVAVKGDIIEKLGENEKKTAKPNVNPLDKKDDDLLKDIK